MIYEVNLLFRVEWLNQMIYEVNLLFRVDLFNQNDL